MDFTYEVVWPGWARAEIRDGDQVARLTASYLSDALGDLLQGVLRALCGANTVEFVWLEEPGEYRWRFETTDDVTVLSITSSADVRREESWNARSGSRSAGSGSGRRTAVPLQLQVKTECVIKMRHDFPGGVPEDRAQSLDGDRAHLLGLGLGVPRQPGCAGGQ